MEEKKAIIIKKKRGFKVFGMSLSFILTVASVFILFMSFNQTDVSTRMWFIVAGSVGIVLFAATFAVFLYLILARSTALAVSDKGLYDFVSGGVGVGLIEKGKITSVRIIGSEKKPMLGIQVDNHVFVIKRAKRKAREAVIYNVDMGRPAIVVEQKDISCSIKEAADILCKTLNGSSATFDFAGDTKIGGSKNTIMYKKGKNLPEKEYSGVGAEKIIDEDAEEVLANKEEKTESDDWEIHPGLESDQNCEETAAENQIEEKNKSVEQPGNYDLSESSVDEELVGGLCPDESVTDVEKHVPKYIFPAENAVKPSDQKEDDPSPEPLFVLNDEK